MPIPTLVELLEVQLYMFVTAAPVTHADSGFIAAELSRGTEIVFGKEKLSDVAPVKVQLPEAKDCWLHVNSSTAAQTTDGHARSTIRQLPGSLFFIADAPVSVD
jgi:hypothetical protein